MVHYICTGGCGAVSATAGICNDLACPLYGMDFTDCSCLDGRHNTSEPAVKDELEDEEDIPKIDEAELEEWEEKFGDEEAEAY